MFFCGNVNYLLLFPIHYAMQNLINEAVFIFQIIEEKKSYKILNESENLTINCLSSYTVLYL